MKLNPKLSFEFIGNACGIFIGNNGTKIICDPWIVDGVFDGSWFHYPPLKTIFDDIKKYFKSGSFLKLVYNRVPLIRGIWSTLIVRR